MEKVKLIDICNPKQWKTISGNEILKEGKYPVYGANGKIGFYSRFTHEFPTVLVTCRGATCGKINLSEPKSYVNGNAMALDNLVDDYDLNYLVHVLKNRGFKDVISGSAQPQITRQGLSKVEIPRPPLSIQKTIAAKLDKAQEVITYNQQLLEKYDQLTQALFIDMFGDPVKNEKGWEKINLGNILKFLTSGSRGWAKYYSDNGDVFLRIQNVAYNKLKLNEIGYVKAPSSAESKRTSVKAGDIVLSITADLGRTAVIPKNFPKAYINQHLAILRINDEFNPNFVSAYIATRGGQLLFNKLDKGGVKAGLNFQDIKSYELFNVPLKLQNQFAERIEKIELQKQMAQESLGKSEELFQSLLKESFK